MTDKEFTAWAEGLLGGSMFVLQMQMPRIPSAEDLAEALQLLTFLRGSCQYSVSDDAQGY